MAEIYQIPDNAGGTPQFTIPIGGLGNGNGLFGNGMNGIVDLFGLAMATASVAASVAVQAQASSATSLTTIQAVS